MDTELLKLLGIIFTSFIVPAIPLTISLIKAIKARKAALTQAEKEKANADLMNVAKQLIQSAETAFDEYNKYMKNRGASAGSVKKRTVLTELKAFALSNKYDFDESKWSETIDSIVELTRNVNSKK